MTALLAFYQGAELFLDVFMIIQPSSAASTHSVVKSLGWWQTHLGAQQWHSGDVKANQRADQLVQGRFVLEWVPVGAPKRAEASRGREYKKKKRKRKKKKKKSREVQWKQSGRAQLHFLCVSREVWTKSQESGSPGASAAVHLSWQIQLTCPACSPLPARIYPRI